MQAVTTLSDADITAVLLCSFIVFFQNIGFAALEVSSIMFCQVDTIVTHLGTPCMIWLSWQSRRLSPLEALGGRCIAYASSATYCFCSCTLAGCHMLPLQLTRSPSRLARAAKHSMRLFLAAERQCESQKRACHSAEELH